MLPKITPNLWFNGNASEATEFYTSVFGGEIVETMNYPSDESLLEDFQKDMAGKVLTVDFQLLDMRFVAINAGPEFRPNTSISFMVNFNPESDSSARERLDELWAKLIEGGRELMPLGEYDFSERYGRVEDRYGYSWQLILTAPGREPRAAIVPCLLFGGRNQGRAQEAIDFYTNELPDAELGNIMRYEEHIGPAMPESIAYSEFRLWDQWFVAMDSGVEQDFSFTEAVSFSISCVDQEEIDTLWDKLSREPEFEQCGWCKDQFGVSWQIVPEATAELLSRPNAYQHMMQMKKLIIADF